MWNGVLKSLAIYLFPSHVGKESFHFSQKEVSRGAFFFSILTSQCSLNDGEHEDSSLSNFNTLFDWPVSHFLPQLPSWSLFGSLIPLLWPLATSSVVLLFLCLNVLLIFLFIWLPASALLLLLLLYESCYFTLLTVYYTYTLPFRRMR